MNLMDINRKLCLKKENPYDNNHNSQLMRDINCGRKKINNYVEPQKKTLLNIRNKSNFFLDYDNKENKMGVRARNIFFSKKVEADERMNNLCTEKDTTLSSSILDKAIASIWNCIDIEGENAVDLFNNDLYKSLTKKGKENFQKIILPHLLSDSQKVGELKNVFFENKINPCDKFSYSNVCQLKRVANERNLCLLVNCDDDNIFQEIIKAPKMLVISKKAFFKIIKGKITSENELTDYTNVLLKTILQMWKCKEIFFNKNEENSVFKCDNSTDHYAFPIQKKSTHLRSSKGEYPLLEEDYKMIEKENLLNYVIHKSIIQMSKSGNVRNSVDLNAQNRSLSKGTIHNKKKCVQIRCLNKKKKKYKDPMGILKTFLKNDTSEEKHNKVFNELSACTFQPNIRKFVEAEMSSIIRGKSPTVVNIGRREIGREFKRETERNAEIEELFKLADGNIIKDVHKSLLKESSNEHVNKMMKNKNAMKYLQMCCLSYGIDMGKKSKHCERKPYDDEEQPLHRISRQIFRTTRENIRDDHPLNVRMEGSKRKSGNRTVNRKYAWENELRGGYISNYFNFSVMHKNDITSESIEKKQHNERKPDWSKEIRLYERKLKAKTVPNFVLSEEMLSSFASANCDVKENFPAPSFFFLKDMKNKIDQSSCKNEQGNIKNDELINCPEGKKKKISSSSSHTEAFLKLHNNTGLMQKYEYKKMINEEKKKLDEMVEDYCSFMPTVATHPPKIVAVKWEKTLDDVEKELFSLPQSIGHAQMF
ncbi:hypothetical protein, conserved [Plasmodium gonderi]|uniref:Uncharacterized protein n=1 Tax=Plasmodium gonderi TaxID=77519 RepID=A0A1Y1JJE5_PLAGO|nr:hypothetical protein, conserved [Plasmodium gonderi]GAW82626.1 hypothetical protein, conserved [Plasmodium gonderi]